MAQTKIKGSMIESATVPTAALADDAVTYAKIQDVTTTDRILGRSTAGAGVVEEIECTAAGRALLDDADASAQRTTLGLAIGTDVQAYDADTAKLDTAQSWTRPQTATPAALTHNTAWDGTQIQHATVDVNGSAFTIANPSSSTSGAIYLVYVVYTTTHSIAWGANFKGVSGVTPTATAGAKDIFVFRSTGTNLELVGYTLNAGA